MWSTHWREEIPTRGTSLRGGTMQTSQSSIRPSARCCTWDFDNPNPKHKVDGEFRADLRRRIWGCLLIGSSTSLSNVSLHSGKPTVSQSASKKGWQAGQRSWLSLCTETQFQVLCLGPPASEGQSPVVVSPEKIHKDDYRIGEPLLQGQAERTKVIQPGDYKQPSSNYSMPTGKLVRNFLQGYIMTGEKVMFLN